MIYHYLHPFYTQVTVGFRERGKTGNMATVEGLKRMYSILKTHIMYLQQTVTERFTLIVWRNAMNTQFIRNYLFEGDFNFLLDT